MFLTVCLVGEKFVRDCPMLEGVKVSLSDVKDEIIIQGNDIEKVSQSAASITDKCRVKDKDIRKFLDGELFVIWSVSGITKLNQVSTSLSVQSLLRTSRVSEGGGSKSAEGRRGR